LLFSKSASMNAQILTTVLAYELRSARKKIQVFISQKPKTKNKK